MTLTSPCLLRKTWRSCAWKQPGRYGLNQVLDSMVTPGRLELPTCGLGNRRSIHLSYGVFLQQQGQFTANTNQDTQLVRLSGPNFQQIPLSNPRQAFPALPWT